MRLKICGITNAEDVAMCSRYADALGFIVGHPESPRSVSVNEARELLKSVPPFVTKVAVIADFSKAKDIYHGLKPDAIQLHGKETLDEVALFCTKVDCTVIKACGIEDALAFSNHADAILIDNKYSPYELEDVQEVIKKCEKPVILAGGLTADNILNLLAKVTPYALDIASGVESAPGKKSAALVKQFRARMGLGPTVGGIIDSKSLVQTFKFFETLSNPGVQIIAEIKPSSPSEGNLMNPEEPEEIVASIVQGGANAISVLVEKEQFGGSVELLKKVRGITKLPILAKGFLYEKEQIDNVLRAGADAYLLMVRVIEAEGQDLNQLLQHGSGLGADAVVEVNSSEEMNSALESGARIIQVNNRDIYGDLAIDLQKASLGKKLRKNVRLICASGIEVPEDIRSVYDFSGNRADAMLIGTSIMRSPDMARKVRELVDAAKEVGG